MDRKSVRDRWRSVEQGEHSKRAADQLNQPKATIKH